MTLFSIWFIQHKKTKLYFPDPKGRQGRGGSFTEATDNGADARIFKTELSAKRFLTAWQKGKYHCARGTDYGHPGNDWETDYYEEVSIEPVPTRNKQDYVIIKKEIEM